MVFAKTAPSDTRLRVAARRVLAASGCGPMRPRARAGRVSDPRIGDAHRDAGDRAPLDVPPTVSMRASSVSSPQAKKLASA